MVHWLTFRSKDLFVTQEQRNPMEHAHLAPSGFFLFEEV
jgi:hypothetical protein